MTRCRCVGLGAVLLFGSLAQGSFSFLSSGFSVLLRAYLYGLGRTPRRKVVLGAIGTPAIILLTMTGGHLLAGTPNVIATLLPSWISGTVFSVVYTLHLRRVERAPGP